MYMYTWTTLAVDLTMEGDKHRCCVFRYMYMYTDTVNFVCSCYAPPPLPPDNPGSALVVAI